MQFGFARQWCALTVCVLVNVACGDDAGTGGSAAGGATTTSGGSTGQAGGPSSGGAAGTGGQTTTGGAGGVGGGASSCPTIPFVDPLPAECMGVGPLAMPRSDTTDCTADSAVLWPARIFAIEVAAGDCLHMRADNVGSPSGADLFGAIVEPSGKSLLFDEEVDCTVANPDGFKCPDGGVTTETAGTAYVIVGSWEGQGCPPDTSTPFTLALSMNGADVDVPEAACSGDLLQIIP